MNNKLVRGTTVSPLLISWPHHIYADLYIKLPQILKVYIEIL